MRFEAGILTTIVTVMFLLTVPASAANRNKPIRQKVISKQYLCGDLLGGLSARGELVVPGQEFNFDTVATFERLYISDTWPSPAFSADNSIMVARASRASKADPTADDVKNGVAIVDLKRLTETFIELPENIRVEAIRISPSGRFATLEAQGGFFTLVDIQKKTYKHIQLKPKGQMTAFYPHFYFTNNDTAYWVSQTGEVWKLNPDKFMKSEAPENTLELYLSDIDSRPATPYWSGQTRDWLLPLNSGDYAISGFISNKGTNARYISNPYPNITLIHASLKHNAVIGMRKNSDGSRDLVELNIDGVAKGQGPRVLWSYIPESEYASYNVAVSEDESHVAVALQQKEDSDAFVIDTKTGEVRLKIPDMLKNSGRTPNYQNRHIWPYKNGFVFFRSNPQVLLKYDFIKNEATEITVSSQQDIEVGPSGSVSYAAHVQVLNDQDGSLSIAPFLPGTVTPGIYHGNERQTGFYVPNTGMGWVHSTPDGSTLVFTVLDEDSKTHELRVVKTSKSLP